MQEDQLYKLDVFDEERREDEDPDNQEIDIDDYADGDPDEEQNYDDY